MAIDIGPATLTSREGNRFTFTGVESRARVRLTILASDLARVEFLPEWVAEPPRSWAVEKPDEDWPDVAVELEEKIPNSLMLRTPDMSIWVTLAPVPFQMQFFNAEGICLSADLPKSLSVVQQDAWSRALHHAARRNGARAARKASSRASISLALANAPARSINMARASGSGTSTRPARTTTTPGRCTPPSPFSSACASSIRR